jgi:hypothetical protein
MATTTKTPKLIWICDATGSEDLGEISDRHIPEGQPYGQPVRVRWVIAGGMVKRAWRYTFGIGSYRPYAPARTEEQVAEWTKTLDANSTCQRATI